MKTFKDFIEEQEEKEFDTLNEDAAQVIGNVLGYATVGLLAAYGGSLIVLGAAKSVKGLQYIWEKIRETIKDETPKSFLFKIKKNKLVNHELTKAEENKKEYGDVLKDVYTAIEEKDFVKTKEKFAALSPQYRNMPEIKQIVINEVTKSLKEPPLWPPSPGNATYKAIRNVLGLAEAKAAAMAVRYHTTKVMEEKDTK